MTITDTDMNTSNAGDVSRAVEEAGARLRDVRSALGRVIFGQGRVIDETLVTLLSGGHLLLIGVPGLAKTKLVDTLGKVLGVEAKRIQCTPDLMPSDIYRIGNSRRRR